MNKRWLAGLVAFIITTTASAQTLFTYGKNSVTAAEFLRAYNKNNTLPVTDKSKAIHDYLDLFINSRLKIREAYERGYDTLPQIKNEVDNLRSQIIENYMSDPETMSRLIKEAFQRSQKDIHVGHLFIAIINGDTLSAFKKANDIYDRLKKGEDFSAIAVQESQDPSAKTNKGDIGWITAFTLPYAFENAIYSTTPGKFSSLVRSKAGYHIFKNIAERKAAGKMKAKQILLAFPPDADETTKKQIAKKADSLYQRIMAGDDFGKLATAFSNDYITSVTGGTMPDFGIGQFDPVFEAKVWALTKDGAVTKPFATTHGYHIVKRTGIVPVVTKEDDKINEQEFRQKIVQDQRWKVSQDIIFNKVVTEGNFKQVERNYAAIWAYSDSILDRKPIGEGKILTPGSPLYMLGDTTYRVSDWINYCQAYRYYPDGSGKKSYGDLMIDFVHTFAMQYYRDHLELFNEDFRNQMTEFKDGNLFFEIMQQEVWNKAHADSAELQALYETNKKKYTWNKSADAVIFFCSDKDVAKTLYDQLKKNPANWKNYSDALVEKVVADSARYEWSQIPNKNKMVPVNGMITTPIINTTDNTASFAYIIKTYPQPSQRSFEEAKGLVINDYQAVLEEQWINNLKKKYPVTVDQKVLESISK